MQFVAGTVIGGIISGLFGGGNNTHSVRHEYHDDPQAQAQLQRISREIEQVKQDGEKRAKEHQENVAKLKADCETQLNTMMKDNQILREQAQTKLEAMQLKFNDGISTMLSQTAQLEDTRRNLVSFVETRRNEIQQEDLKLAEMTREKEKLEREQDQKRQTLQSELELARVHNTQAVAGLETQLAQHNQESTQANSNKLTELAEHANRIRDKIQTSDQQDDRLLQGVISTKADFERSDKAHRESMEYYRANLSNLFGTGNELSERSERASQQSKGSAGNRSMYSKNNQKEQELRGQLSGLLSPTEIPFVCGRMIQASAFLQENTIGLLTDIKTGNTPGSLGEGCSIVCPLIAFLGYKRTGDTLLGECGCSRTPKQVYRLMFESHDPSKLKVASFAPLQQ